MIIRNKEELSLFINISIASAKISSIEIEQEEGIYNLRPQLHIILTGDKGSCKSTVLNEVSKHFKQSPYNSMTEAGLIGSIEKNTRNFLEGSAWTCRNSLMCIDEFSFSDSKGRPMPLIPHLLSLCEHPQTYKKKVGLAVNPFKKRTKDLYIIVKEGVLEFKTNFALLIGTMSRLNFKNPLLDAFKSRCLPIRWHPDITVVHDVAKGKKIFKYQDLLKKNTKKTQKVRINALNYTKITSFCEQNCLDAGLYLRVLGDCCRVYAILQKHDFYVYKLILDIKKDKKRLLTRNNL